MTSLYQLVDLYKKDLETLEDLDLDEQTLADTLDSLTGELEVKATNVAMFVRNLEATAAAIKDAESQMAARRKAMENRAKRVKQYLKDCMATAGISKIEHPMLALSIRKNPPSVEILDDRQIPAEYWVTPPPPEKQISKTLIMQALKSGVDVPGAKLTQSERLDIQ